MGGLGGPLNPCGPSVGLGGGGEQDVNAPYWCQWSLVWDHRTFPHPSPRPPTMSPLTGFPSGPASPLSPGRPWSKRWGWGQRQAGGCGQCLLGGQRGTHRGAVPPLLAGLPSLTPRATLTLQWGQAQGHRTGRDLPIPLQGLLTPKEECPQQCPRPGLCSMGLPPWRQETYDCRPYLLWVPARPQLPARPVSGRRQMPSAPAAPLGMPALPPPSVPAQLITLSPAQSPWLPRSSLPSHAPSLPWVRQGRARPGSPSGCPPPRLPAGRAQSGLAPQEGLPRGPLRDHPQQQPSPTLGPGGPGGPGKPSLPWDGEKNRLSIRGTAGHGGGETSRYGIPWPP